jgi:hypothetical protein
MVKEFKDVKVRVFNAQAFLKSAGVARKVKELKKADILYSQGDAADSVALRRFISCYLSKLGQTPRFELVTNLQCFH